MLLMLMLFGAFADFHADIISSCDTSAAAISFCFGFDILTCRHTALLISFLLMHFSRNAATSFRASVPLTSHFADAHFYAIFHLPWLLFIIISFLLNIIPHTLY